MKTNKVSKSIAILLTIGFLGVSFLMIAPVEEAEAWWRHNCSKWVYIDDGPNGEPIEVYVPCVIYHWYPLSHDFDCDSACS